MRISAVIHLFLFIGCSALLIAISNYLPLMTLGSLENGWFPVVSLVHNSYHSWRVDHVVRALQGPGEFHTITDVLPVQLALLLLGTFLCFKRISIHRNAVFLWSAALLVASSVLLTVGRDPVTLGAIAWIPLLTLFFSAVYSSTTNGISSGAGPLWLLLLFFSIEHARSANQLALPMALAALALGIALAPREEKEATKTTTSSWAHASSLAIVCILAPSIYVTVTAPLAPFPDYPGAAHVVPLSGLPYIPRPLLGSDSPLPVVDREGMQHALGVPALLCALGGIVTFFFAIRSGSRALATAIFTVAILGIVVSLDLLSPIELSVISPIASISRLFPIGTSLPIDSVVLASAIWLGSFVLAAAGMSAAAIPWVATTIAGCLLAPYAQLHLAPINVREAIQRALVEEPEQRRLLISPSLYVFRYFERSMPGFISELPKYLAFTKQLPVTAAQASPAISVNPSSLGQRTGRMLDGRGSTRWSTERGSQQGDEVLTLQFQNPVTAYGIDLSPGHFPADFPRGITIAGIDCSSHLELWNVSFPDWQGSLSFTPSGYPYFGGQSDVRVLFGQERRLECLSISQTSVAPFDWSIAELGLIK